jgi:hypothetical protein
MCTCRASPDPFRFVPEILAPDFNSRSVNTHERPDLERIRTIVVCSSEVILVPVIKGAWLEFSFHRTNFQLTWNDVYMHSLVILMCTIAKLISHIFIFEHTVCLLIIETDFAKAEHCVPDEVSRHLDCFHRLTHAFIPVILNSRAEPVVSFTH